MSSTSPDEKTHRKRRLTGYEDDTEDVIKNRIHLWEERGKETPCRRVASSKIDKSGRKSKKPSKCGSQAKSKSKAKSTSPAESKDPTKSQVHVSSKSKRHKTEKTGRQKESKEKVKFARESPTRANKRIGETSIQDVEGRCKPCNAVNRDYEENICRTPYKSDGAPYPINDQPSLNDFELSLRGSMDRINYPKQIRPCAIPQNVNPEERKLLHIAYSGSVVCMQGFIASHCGVNINAKSYEGMTALKIAVWMGHEAMVDFLCSCKGIALGNILMYAICYRQYTIVKCFCELYNLDRKTYSVLDENFPRYITPLSFAAEVGCYEIIDYLLNVRGHDLICEPHAPDCRCRPTCNQSRKGDPIDFAYKFLHIYSALSQPAYYIHTTNDPLMRSFELNKTLKCLSEVFVPLKTHFIKLAERTEKFAADLIAECRTSAEVQVVLSRRYYEVPSIFNKLVDIRIPQLTNALDYDQKSLVALPNLQIVLDEMWIGDYLAWKNSNFVHKTVSCLTRLFMLPYVCFLILVKPGSAAAKHYSLPVNKMITSLSCYFLFLVLIFYGNMKTRPKFRTAYTLNDVKFYLSVFVFMYTLNAFRIALSVHPKRYFAYKWNVYDVATLLAFWLAIAFWISAQVHYSMINKTERKLERKYWGAMDPVLMADGFFVIGSVLAYLKVFFYSQINDDIGPLQVKVDWMVKEFIKYSVFWLIILLTFTVALGNFYAYYSGMRYSDCHSYTVLQQEDSFTSFKNTFKTLFFGMFGLSPLSSADVVIENIKTRNGVFLNQHHFTEFIGYAAFAAYTIMMGIIVVNMVIATMATSFAKAVANVDTEWMINRAKVHLYFEAHPVLSAPFNLSFQSYLQEVSPKAPKNQNQKSCSSPPPSPPPPPPPPQINLSYEEVVKKLLLRYFHSKAEGRRRSIMKECPLYES